MHSDLDELILKFLGIITYTNTEDNKVIIWILNDKGSHDSELKHNLALPAADIKKNSWSTVLFVSQTESEFSIFVHLWATFLGA